MAVPARCACATEIASCARSAAASNWRYHLGRLLGITGFRQVVTVEVVVILVHLVVVIVLVVFLIIIILFIIIIFVFVRFIFTASGM